MWANDELDNLYDYKVNTICFDAGYQFGSFSVGDDVFG